MSMMVGSDKKISVFVPESFEYLILKSGVIEIPKSIMEETWNYADSVKYFSWEEFYTHYLADLTKNGIRKYSKARLGEYYKTAGNVDKVVSVLPKCIRDVIH